LRLISFILYSSIWHHWLTSWSSWWWRSADFQDAERGPWRWDEIQGFGPCQPPPLDWSEMCLNW